MGHISASHNSGLVMPELLIRNGNRFLLVRGTERGREYWWPPGAYWLTEKACNLAVEQPTEWVERVLADQVNLVVHKMTLLHIAFVAPSHPPVMVFQLEVNGEPAPNNARGFDAAKYFSIDELPTVLGRDEEHGTWLRTMLKTHTA
jgi:hypothetical protein